jgi:hypothetical protein
MLRSSSSPQMASLLQGENRRHNERTHVARTHAEESVEKCITDEHIVSNTDAELLAECLD